MNARRKLIAALSEDSLGGIATLQDVDHAEQLVNAHRAEILREVDEQFAAMKLPEELKGTFNAGSYADAWRRCRTAVQAMAGEEATPQGATATPHAETFDGELAMLRGLVRVLRTVARQDDLREVQRLLAEHASDENAARAGAKRARMWPKDWDQVLDTAIRDEGGEWTTLRVQHLYKARYEVGLFRGDARMCLSERAHKGLLQLHDRPSGRVYTLKNRKDGRP